MKAILMSIQPKWCELIASGEKTIEVRKTAPKEVPFKVYMYESLGKKISCRQCAIWQNCPMRSPFGCNEGAGAVVGEFICDKIEECIPDYNPVTQEFFYNEWEDSEAACLTAEEQSKYGKGKPLYGLHISELKIYDEPKELGEFRTIKCTNKNGSCSDCNIKPNCMKYLSRPPKSWQYVEEVDYDS